MKAKETTPLADETVIVEFLQRNNDFFSHHPELLLQMSLPHQAGTAVSLVEKQISMLRTRNSEMRIQLDTLLDTAKENSALFQKICNLTLALMETKSINDIDLVLSEQLATQFSAAHVRCYICANSKYEPKVHLRFTTNIPHIGLMKAEKIVCGAIRSEEFSLLFPDVKPASGSTVLIPLKININKKPGELPIHGLLAIGSNDAQHFTSDLGTEFLAFLGKMLSCALEAYV
ncbi:MAG: DUF484 family protein [Pseudomonadales bacterium]|nr:DUF484 family protein [Pseudomonadales bacterium]